MLFTLEMSTLFGLPIIYQGKIRRHKLIEVIYIPTIGQSNQITANSILGFQNFLLVTVLYKMHI